MLHDQGAVEQQRAHSHRHSYYGYNVCLACALQQAGHARLCPLKQRLLPEEVLARIAGYGKFGKDDDFGTLIRCLEGET